MNYDPSDPFEVWWRAQHGDKRSAAKPFARKAWNAALENVMNGMAVRYTGKLPFSDPVRKTCKQCGGKGNVATMGTPYDSGWEKCPECKRK